MVAPELRLENSSVVTIVRLSEHPYMLQKCWEIIIQIPQPKYHLKSWAISSFQNTVGVLVAQL